MRHPAVAVWLPPDEFEPVALALAGGGFEAICIRQPIDLEEALAARPDLAIAIIDGESDFDASLIAYELLHQPGRDVATLMIVSPRALDRVAGAAAASASNDEFVTRPYSAESLRWRVEAMLIRAQTVDDGSGAVLQGGSIDTDWTRRATVVAVFNPKGGVGKTTIATNLAAVLAGKKHLRVLLIDADTVTGHVATSLGLEQVRTVVDSWRDEAQDGVAEGFLDIASAHSSGMRVISLTSSPLHTEVLDPHRLGNAIAAARRSFDFIIVDMHPSYGPLTLAIFDQADRILLPVTPDLPAIRAAVQLRDVAGELGIADRLSLVINRANSGVSVADMERTVGLPALALIRSGGLLFVRAANEGRTLVEKFPKEKVSEDYALLADRLVPGVRAAAPAPKPALKSFFGRKETVRA